MPKNYMILDTGGSDELEYLEECGPGYKQVEPVSDMCVTTISHSKNCKCPYNQEHNDTPQSLSSSNEDDKLSDLKERFVKKTNDLNLIRYAAEEGAKDQNAMLTQSNNKIEAKAKFFAGVFLDEETKPMEEEWERELRDALLSPEMNPKTGIKFFKLRDFIARLLEEKERGAYWKGARDAEQDRYGWQSGFEAGQKEATARLKEEMYTNDETVELEQAARQRGKESEHKRLIALAESLKRSLYRDDSNHSYELNRQRVQYNSALEAFIKLASKE